MMTNDGHMDEAHAKDCAGKYAFQNPRDARRAAAGRGGKGYRMGTRQEPYRCRHCSRWHLGSAPRRTNP